MGTPYVSREGKHAARQADRRAGGGGWKKRTPSCNGVDRGCAHGQHDPTRKRADVHLVLHHQRPWPTSTGEKADDGSGDTDWCTLRPDDGPEAPSAYGEGGAPWHHRVPQGAFARLELLEGKLSRAVLRGLSGSNPSIDCNRLNLDLRQHVAAIGRRVATLCKGEDGLRHQLSLFQTYHNFCLPHASLHQPLPQPLPTNGTGSAKQWRPYTPAMAAGLTDHVWSLREVLLYRVPPWPQPAGV